MKPSSHSPHPSSHSIYKHSHEDPVSFNGFFVGIVIFGLVGASLLAVLFGFEGFLIGFIGGGVIGLLQRLAAAIARMDQRLRSIDAAMHQLTETLTQPVITDAETSADGERVAEEAVAAKHAEPQPSVVEHVSETAGEGEPASGDAVVAESGRAPETDGEGERMVEAAEPDATGDAGTPSGETLPTEHPAESEPESVSPAEVLADESAEQPSGTTTKPDYEEEFEPMAPAALRSGNRNAGAAPAAPRPGPGNDVMKRMLRWMFTGENAVVRIGLLVLFIGVAMLYRYGVEQQWFSVSLPMKFVAVTVVALTVLVWGWRLRHRRRNYALLVQGGAVGMLFLTVYAAARLFDLLPPVLAFFIMLGLVLLSAALALLQNARALATAGAVGGFLAPLLTSSEVGSHVMLFSYYALLDIGILAIAWYRPWRELNLIGFYFTLVVSGVWAWQAWRPEHLATTEPFLILFFVMFSLLGVLHALRSPPKLRGFVDGTLVFGTPLVAFGLQWLLLHDAPRLAALAALVLAGWYVGLARWLWLRKARTDEALRPLVEALLAIGVGFLIVMVPLAVDGVWVQATWALQGAALVWVGVRQCRLLATLTGFMLQLATGAYAFFGQSVLLGTLGGLYAGSELALLMANVEARQALFEAASGRAMVGILIGLAGLFSAWIVRRRRAEWEVVEAVEWLALFWGLGWLLLTLFLELRLSLPATEWPGAWLVGASVIFAALRWVARRLDWTAAASSFVALLPGMWLMAAIQWVGGVSHPLAGWGAIGWPLAFVVWFRGVWVVRHNFSLQVGGGLYVAAVWLLYGLIGWELQWQMKTLMGRPTLWSELVWIWSALVLLAGPGWRQRPSWLLPAEVGNMRDLVLWPLGVLVYAWLLVTAVTHDGRPEPLEYLPVLNPLELTQLFVMVVLLALLARNEWWRGLSPRWRWSAVGLTVFLWVDGTLARVTHHFFGVPFRLDRMLDSFVYQAMLSVFWGLGALLLMIFGARRRSRLVWFVGLGLYGLTVAKLFLVDLSGRDTLARIVSFLVVGVLLVATGYFAPMPGVRKQQAVATGQEEQ